MIEARNLAKRYPVVTGLRSLFSSDRNRFVHAVDGIDFSVARGEVLGIAGESGCGKSTTAKLLVGLERPSDGSIVVDGEDLFTLHEQDRRAFYRRVQMIFQDPYGSINPSHDVFSIIARPLIYQGVRNKSEIEDRVHAAMERVGLVPIEVFLGKHPHLLSGGQRQRLCIARAAVLEPKFIVADEPVSMLDVSIKWDIIRLMKRLVAESEMSLIYITHDLATVATICDRLAIMYLGRIVEMGPVQDVLRRPAHPYTKALIASIPSTVPDEQRPRADIHGGVPNAIQLPQGCRFRDRCPIGDSACTHTEPALAPFDGRDVACIKTSAKPAPPESRAGAGR